MIVSPLRRRVSAGMSSPHDFWQFIFTLHVRLPLLDLTDNPVPLYSTQA